VGTNKGVVLYGHNTFKVLNQELGLIDNHVKSLSKFKNFLAIGTEKGLSLYNLNTGKFVNYHEENGLIDESITTLLNQDNKFLWIGSPSGLLQFDGEQFSYYNIGTDNNSNQVRSMILDREQNIWLGTHSGLFRYRDNSFSSFDKVPGLSNSLIFQIVRDRRQDLWVCTQNNGVFRQSQSFFKRYGPAEGLVTNTSHSALEDHAGRMWFGTDVGLSLFKNDKFLPQSLGAKYRGPCEVLYEDKGGKLWVGGTDCFTSVSQKNDHTEIKTYELHTPANAIVYGFAEDEEGRFYIGTFKGGLWLLEKGVLRNISAELQLNEETFFTIRYAEGKIFAASLNGLLVFDTKSKRLTRISDSDGLNSELVYSIEITGAGRWMWIGTNQGINRLDLKKYLSSGAIDIIAFGRQEGFTGVECNGNGIWEDKDGTLWFGTVSGLVKHQPARFKLNTTQNKTVIQTIKILNEDTLLGDSVVLPSDFNVLSFYYRGVCLTNPQKVMYQRKLIGLDKDWSPPSTEDFIKYTNLAPGSYTFMIRSCNNEGIWNSKETSFIFRIRPPFYLTWWFILLSFSFVFGGIYAFFAIRIYTIKKKQKADYERRVEMSKIELKALRSQMNPHFIFNSLNSIQHYIFNTRSDEAIKYLNKFARLVRIILNNSERPTVTVGDDLEALRLYLELEQMRFEEKFDYEIIIDPTVDVDYDIMPPLLMQPYVENAILHGLNPRPDKGKLTIRLYSENNFLICTISDNGIGREKAAEIRRTMPVKKHKSLGMKITEDRLKILNEINNSQLSVTITDLKNADGSSAGTQVELFVPLNG
jgi:ligand-binding sensor domain-containing protein/two-component sensor histidine kinase